jgi:hypothetical protein
VACPSVRLCVEPELSHYVHNIHLPPHRDWGRARTAGNRFARDDKEPGPSWGKQLPGEQPRETAET